MPVFVNTNISALNATRFLNRTQNNLDTIYQRLSTGLRINSAKDDPAGLMISNRLTTEINGLTQGNRNASDGVALLQTQEGAMDEITSMLQSMRTLAIQAANGATSDTEREALNKQAAEYADEITRLAQSTTYGGKLILDGAGGDSLFATDDISLQVGANAGDTIGMTSVDMKFETIYGATAADLSTQQAASDALDDIDAALKNVDTARAGIGATQLRLEASIRSQENSIVNIEDARSRIRDADYATEVANFMQQSILQQTVSAMLMQANTRPQLALSLLG